MLSTVAAGVFEADLDGRVVFANPAALRMLQYEESEIVGKTVPELGVQRYDAQGELLADDTAPIRRAGRASRDTLHSIIRYVRPGVFDKWLESYAAPAYNAAGELTGTVVSFADITDRLRLEEAERKGRERLDGVLHATAVGILLVDEHGRIEYANTAAAAISGLRPEDVIGQLVADPAWQLTDDSGRVLSYEELPVTTALRERRVVRGVELGLPTMVGLRWMRVSAHPLFNADGSLRGAVVTTEDVTERHALTEQLLQSQKIESVGQLAGGIAHDFNNLLTVIAGNAALIQHDAAHDSPAGESAAEILDATARGASLTRQLLMFARRQVVQPRAVGLDRLLDSLRRLLHRALGENIRVEMAIDDALWTVRVDPGQMEQVIVNLAINARDAMPEGGTLRIALHNRIVDEREASGHPGTHAGEFVTLVMRDTGIGIPPDVLPRIFEPFFTTKAVGRGSGLGLSICDGVIRQAHGFIDVDSTVGVGTTFRLNLPRTIAAPDDVLSVTETSLTRGRGRVLLVEDEQAVRQMLERALSGYGYDVTSVASGVVALDAHANASATGDAPFDLLLTDVVMPEIGGIEVARLLRERQPSLKVLFMTGYVDMRAMDGLGIDIEEQLLLKPFTPMQLAQRVQQMLAKSKSEW